MDDRFQAKKLTLSRTLFNPKSVQTRLMSPRNDPKDDSSDDQNSQVPGRSCEERNLKRGQKMPGYPRQTRNKHRCCLPALAGFTSPRSMGPGAVKLGVGIPAEQVEFPESSTATRENTMDCRTDLVAWVCERLFTETATRVLHGLPQLAVPIGLNRSRAANR